METTTKKPKTLKGWQKLYPSAMKISGTGTKILSRADLIKMSFGEGKGKVLCDNSSATWTSKGGNKVRINAVVCKIEDYEAVKINQQSND